MTKDEIKLKTSICFLFNPNISDEEKKSVIEKVISTKATIVPKSSLCNIITYLLKQNAKLKELENQYVKLKYRFYDDFDSSISDCQRNINELRSALYECLGIVS